MFISSKEFDAWKKMFARDIQDSRDKYWDLRHRHERLLEHLGLYEREVSAKTELLKTFYCPRGYGECEAARACCYPGRCPLFSAAAKAAHAPVSQPVAAPFDQHAANRAFEGLVETMLDLINVNGMDECEAALGKAWQRCEEKREERNAEIVKGR